MRARYELHLTTNGGFEVCAFMPYCFGDGTPMKPSYVLRRHVETVEEVRWLIRVPLAEAKASFVGARR